MGKAPRMKLSDRFRTAYDIMRRGTFVMPVNEYKPDFGIASAAGVAVSASNASKLSAVYACVRLLSEQPASLQCNVVRTKDGKREDLTGGSIHSLLHAPNKFMNSFSFTEMMNARVQLRGDAIAVIIFDFKGEPTELIPINPGCWRLKILNREPFYVIDDNEMDIHGTFMYWEIIHFKNISLNGYTGLSTISAAREAIGLGLASEHFGADFFGKGGNLKGTLETEGTMDDKQFAAWKKRWDTYYGGPVGDHTTPILEYGMKYKPIGVAPNDAQFIETRVFQIQEIARFFNVPPTFLAELSRGTFSNGEQLDLQFVKYTLRPLLKRQEVELEAKLVNRKDRGTISIKYNMDSLLRADMKTRAAYEQTLVSTGIMTRNEARTIELLPPLEGLDVPIDPAFLSGKNTPLSATSETEKNKNKGE
jgi:HK97 family phage portal protein